MVFLPRIETSTHVVVPEPAASARLSTRRNRRRCLKDQVHQIWHAEITDWLENRDQCQTFGRDDKERADLLIWFNAIDVGNSGGVEEGDIRAFMKAMGVEVSPSLLAHVFKMMGFKRDAQLDEEKFYRLMTEYGSQISGGAHFAAREGGRAFEIDSNTRLVMLAYRRQRLLKDLRDPTKRRRFADAEAFNKYYGKSSLLQAPISPTKERASTTSLGSPTLPPLPNNDVRMRDAVPQDTPLRIDTHDDESTEEAVETVGFRLQPPVSGRHRPSPPSSRPPANASPRTPRTRRTSSRASEEDTADATDNKAAVAPAASVPGWD
uniref:EF-hand domain-containing protein n=1 Tax=Chrysotila carterae TaxID=13221 RepID=A0A6T0AME8_CHRCT|mmetsp:Transcript_7783/g.17116  ORF Transcript_7783/g.17116 Transcript_7783/m.17116 type:complete len:321 (+) Transcript_7783:323-1285(+)